MHNQRAINHLLRAYDRALKKRSPSLHNRWLAMSDGQRLLFAISWSWSVSDEELQASGKNIGPKTVEAIRSLS